MAGNWKWKGGGYEHMKKIKGKERGGWLYDTSAWGGKTTNWLSNIGAEKID